MQTLYDATITGIGSDVPLIAEENVLIFFDEKAPKELHDVAVLHKNGGLSGEVKAGDKFVLDGAEFRIAFVGDTANSSIRELGHFTVNFTGNTSEALPGTIYVEAASIPEIESGAIYRFIRD
ncbi:PTS glucitol/sorbitol transporter subunit IIA [Paenibacillus tyrfis]|uniref:PTS sorbitol transporter subunit IIA n=1 Tax=Paenibacillus tyrfis TaxID=1501230 RepID=A0A081NSY4_9BACL|nr:PTS glucitol/sorbitol transporter subunit IIA [Paenibacillus tyrfis]KEQ21557.1 hypothetical protein ET33_37695 [Paenibacillus tyrfis]